MIVNAAITPPAPKQRHLRWPLIVIGLLVGHMCIMFVAVALATRGHSAEVIPGYYQKAANWDRAQAELRASEKLAWTVTVTPAPEVDPLGRRNVLVRVRDATDRAIADADIELSYFQLSHPADLQHAQLRTDAGGQAQATLPMRYEGFWQIDVTATAGGQHFVKQLSQFVSTAKQGTP
jgi:nitrogen fixation protein FixH